MTHITFCQMTQNRLHETRHCIEKYLPYVDKIIIVDGGSIDDTIITLRNWSEVEPKLEFYLHPWSDDFSAQRNNYLQHVPNDTWALISDPDEWFEDNTLQNLAKAIQLAESMKKDMIGFQCRSVSYKGQERVWENLDNYHKRLLFKKYPKTHYAGNPHEHLVNHPHQILDTKLIYEHVKQENVIWHRGARNMWTGGGGPNLGEKNPRWIDLRRICNELGLYTWHQYDQYLIKGNIDKRLKEWMYKYKDETGWDGASEHTEMWKLYYKIYHPEEIE